MDFPKKGTRILLIMRSGAVYNGVFQRYKADGGGQVELSNVKIVSRKNHYNWLICPKQGMNRTFWISKVDRWEIGE
jgi:hypothetical protein